MTHLIQVFRHKGLWVMKDSDPSLQALHGTDITVTQFHAEIAPSEVLRTVKQSNPHKNVLLRHESIRSLDSI